MGAPHYKFRILSGPFKGLEARLVSQPLHNPDFVSIQLREDKTVYMYRFNSLLLVKKLQHHAGKKRKTPPNLRPVRRIHP